jgi:hypothetical protein
MDGVKQVKDSNDRPRQWTAGIAHPGREWEAKITGQTADERLAASGSGVVAYTGSAGAI